MQQIQVNMAFTADTAQARAQLQSLQQQLNNLTSATNLGGQSLPITSELLEAQNAATSLKIALEGATNVNTGKLDLSKFNQSLKSSGQTLSSYSVQLAKLGSAGEQAFANLTNAIIRSDAQLRRTSGLADKFFDGLKRTAGWQIQSTMIHAFTGSIQTAFGYAQDLNKSLNNIRIVTGQSVDQMARFAKEANRAAKSLSTTTTEYTNASLIYYQQGLSDQEVKNRTDITIKAANAAGVATSEMADYLTAVWNSYGVAGAELERYVDIMAAVGAGTATSLEEISTSMEKVASVGAAVGVEFEQMSSIIATVSSVTRQSAESIGTSYKTIFARMADLKLGKADEDGIGLGQVSSQLAQVGVNILDETGNLRDMGVVLDELMAKWNNMNEATQQAVAIAVAGKRQYTNFLALMNNQSMYRSTLGIAEGAEGTLDQQAEIYAQSWEAASKRVKTSAQTIYDALINDETMIDALGFAESFLNSIGGIIKGLGGLSGVLTGLGSIATQVFSKQIAQGIDNFVFNVKSRFGIVHDEMEQLRQEAMRVRQEFYQQQGGMGGNTALTFYGQQDEMQDILLRKTKDLNEEQQRYAQTLLDTANNYSRVAIESNQSLDAQINSVNALEKAIGRTLDKTAQQQVADGLKQSLIGARNENLSVFGDTLFGKNSNIQEELQKVQTQIQQVEGAAKSSGLTLEQYLGNAGAKAVKTIKQELEQANPSVDKIQDQFRQLGSISNTQLTQASQVINNVVQKLREMNTTTSNMQADRLEQIFADIVEGAQNADRASQNAVSGLDKLKQKMLELQQQPATLGQSMTALANVMTSLAFTIQSIQALGSIWKNEDLSTGEKILSILMQLGFALNSFINLLKADTWAKIIQLGTKLLNGERLEIKAIAQKTKAKYEEIKARILNAKAKQAENAVPEGGDSSIPTTGKKRTFKFSGNKGLTAGATGKMVKGVGAKGSLGAGSSGGGGASAGGAAAGLGAIAAIVAAAVFAFSMISMTSDKLNEEEEAVKETTELASELQTAAQEAASAYENLKTSLDSLDDNYDKIKDLTKGTQEWKDAVWETNNEALKLLETYDMLSSENYYRDEDGIIHITEEAQKKMRQEGQQKQLTTSIAAKQVKVNSQYAQQNLALNKQAEERRWDEDATAWGTGAGAGLATGALAGMAFGPVGAIVGGLIGLGIGFFAGGSVIEAQQEEDTEDMRQIGELYAEFGEEIFSNSELTASLDENGQAILDNTKSNKELKEAIIEYGLWYRQEEERKKEQSRQYLESTFGDSQTWTEMTEEQRNVVNEQLYQAYERDIQAEIYAAEQLSGREVATKLGYEFISEDEDEGTVEIYNTKTGQNETRKRSTLDTELGTQVATQNFTKQAQPVVSRQGDIFEDANKTAFDKNVSKVASDTTKEFEDFFENPAYIGNWEEYLINEIVKNVNADVGTKSKEDIIKELKKGKESSYVSAALGTSEMKKDVEWDPSGDTHGDVAWESISGQTTYGDKLSWYDAFVKNLENKSYTLEKYVGKTSRGVTITDEKTVNPTGNISSTAEQQAWNRANSTIRKGQSATTVAQAGIENAWENLPITSEATLFAMSTATNEFQASNAQEQAIREKEVMQTALQQADFGTLNYEEVNNLFDKFGYNNNLTFLNTLSAQGWEDLNRLVTSDTTTQQDLEEFFELWGISDQIDQNNTAWKNFAKSLKTEGEKAQTTIEALKENFEDIKTAITQANDAIINFNENGGRMNFEDAINFVNAYASSLGSQGYNTTEVIERLLTGDIGNAEMASIMNYGLRYQIESILGKSIGEYDQDKLQMILESMGVTNAEAIVAEWIKADDIAREIDREFKDIETTIKSRDLSEAMAEGAGTLDEVQTILNAIANEYGISTEAAKQFWMQNEALRVMNMDESGLGDWLEELIQKFGMAGAQAMGLASVIELFYNIDEDGNLSIKKNKDIWSNKNFIPMINRAGYSQVKVSELDKNIQRDEAQTAIIEKAKDENDGGTVYVETATGTVVYDDANELYGVVARSEMLQYAKDINSIMPTINLDNSTASTPTPKDLSDEIERYQKINEQLEINARAQRYAQDALNKTYGPDKLAAMDKYIAKLKEENDLLDSKQDLAMQYAKSDMANLQTALGAMGFGEDQISSLTALDDTQHIANQDLLIATMVAQANANLSNEGVQQAYEDAKEFLSKYTESINMAQDLEIQMWENRTAIQDENLERIKAEYEEKKRIYELDKERLQFEMDMLNPDVFEYQDEILSRQAKQIELSLTQDFTNTMNEISDLEAAFYRNDISKQDFGERLNELVTEAFETFTNAQEFFNSYSENFLNVFEMSNEQIETQTSLINGLKTALTSLMNLYKLQNKGANFEDTEKFLKSQANTQKELLGISQEVYTTRKALLAAEEEKLKTATGTFKQQQEKIVEDLRQQTLDAYTEMLANGEEYAETLAEILRATFDELGKQLAEALVGDTFENLNKEMEHLTAVSEHYLTETNKVYETNKMMRTAEIELSNTQNKLAQQRLQSFIQETAQLQQQGKLSNFELEVQQAKYDLLVAQIALEDAQNAKNQVRLARDSRGNFNYIYTADQNEIAKATQEVEDAENNLYNVLLEGANDYRQQMIEIYQNYADEIADLESQLDEGLISKEEFMIQANTARERAYKEAQMAEEAYTQASTLLGDKWKEAWVNNLDDSIASSDEFYKESQKNLDKVEQAVKDFDTEVDKIIDLDEVDRDLGNIDTAVGNLALTIKQDLLPALTDMVKELKKIDIEKMMNAFDIQKNVETGAGGKLANAQDIQNSLNTGTEYKFGQDLSKDILTATIKGGSQVEDLESTFTARAEKIWALSEEQRSNLVGNDDLKKLIWKYGYNDAVTAWLNDILAGNSYLGVDEAIRRGIWFTSLDTGGYTGEWGSEGRLAMLHQKELVLNENDTANFLAAMGLLDKIIETIDLRAANAQLGMMNITPVIPVTPSSVVEQDVHIEAHFPDVTSADEIEAALNNLVNDAYQHASIRKD